MQISVGFCWSGPARFAVLVCWKGGDCSKMSVVPTGLHQLVHNVLEDSLFGFAILVHIHVLGFNVACFLPPASTWSRARNHGEGQEPLRSSSKFLGLDDMNPQSSSKVTVCNHQLEFIAWFSQEALCCLTSKIWMRGGEGEEFWLSQKILAVSLSRGPYTTWTLRKSQALEALHDGHRQTFCLCQLGCSDQMRSWGILTRLSPVFSLLHPGWHKFQMGFSNSAFLSYSCPLQRRCSCSHDHKPMRGVSADGVFLSQSVTVSLAERFANFVGNICLERSRSQL